MKPKITPEGIELVSKWIWENRKLLRQLNNFTHAHEYYYQVGKDLPDISTYTFRRLMIDKGIKKIHREGPRRYCSNLAWMHGMEARVKRLEKVTT